MRRPNPQLQLFAAVQFVYGLVSVFDLFSTCSLLTGQSSCSPTEILLLSMLGLPLALLGVAFSVLTTAAYDDAPKKRRLAFVAMHCVSAQVCGAILAGSHHMGGIMPRRVHIAEVAIQLVLFLVLGTAVWGSDAGAVSVAGGNPLGVGRSTASSP